VKRGKISEEPRPSVTALRRQQFQERLRAERAETASPQRTKVTVEEHAEESRGRQTLSTRRVPLREERQAVNELADIKSSQAAEARIAQFKTQTRAARQVQDAERIAEEQALHAAAMQQSSAEQERRRAVIAVEAQRLERQRESEARQQGESELHAARLQKKAQREQAAAAKLETEALILQRKARQKEQATAKPVELEPVLPEPNPVRVEPAPGISEEKRSARIDTGRQREAEELRAATAKKQHDSLEVAAAARQDERRELKRQAARQAQLESQSAVDRVGSVARRTPPRAEPEPPLVGHEGPKPAAGMSLAPRAISGGSTSRAIPAAPAEAATAASQTPAETAPLVQTRSSFIIDENGDAVILRGITVRGLDTVTPPAGQTLPSALSLDAGNLTTITDQWGANLVRLPFAASTILNGNGGLAASDLLAGLDLTVAGITGAGAYVLLALETAPGAGPDDKDALRAWQTLATRYQGEPRVFYEVFASLSPIAADFATAFATVIATIRQIDSESLIFVPGSASGLDVTAVPQRDANRDPVPNLVYTIAVSVQSVPNPDVLSAVSAAHPVFASVWSDDGSDLGRQASRIADLFERCGIGWAAANWNSYPRLVMNAPGGDFNPTIWGNVVLRAIKLTAPPLLEPADAPASLATVRAETPKLSRLSTSNNFILDESGKAIALRGATIAGLDTAAPASGQTLADALAIDTNNLALMTRIWGLNLVRLPFKAETVLTGNGTIPAGKILAGIDLAVTMITEAGAYVLLALEAEPGATLPDASTQQAWQTMAKRYKDEPGVLYEIFASPQPLAAGWFQTALSLIGTIRSQNTAAMIFVNTGNSGDFTGLPLLLPTGVPIFNVVYTVNVSPQNSPGPDDGQLASFADLYPVFASTWSDDAMNPSRVSPYVGDFFARHGIGFAAANWNADPRLVADALNQDFSSTAWGLIAGRAATLPVRQMLKAF